MKTLADFKRRLKVGTLLATESRHGDLGIRPVSIVQSNAFALKTTRPDGTVADSWCEFPKARDFKVVDENTVLISVDVEVTLKYTFV